MRVRKFPVVLMWLVLGSGAAPASAQAPPLSAERAVAEALEANPAIRARRQDAAVAFERPAQERSLMPPMVEAEIWEWPVTTLNPAKVDMYMFTVEQEYPGRGKRGAREALARREAEAGLAVVPALEQDVALQVRLAWNELAAARRLHGVYEQSLDTLRVLGEASTTRYAAAAGGQQDVLRNIVEIAAVRRDLVAVRERARLAEVRLATLLGRDPGSRIEPLTEPVPAPDHVDAAQLVTVAQDGRAELIALEAERRRIDAALAVIEIDRRPDWVVGGGYMLTPGEAGAWTARAGLTWPRAPWARGRFDAQVREQEAARRALDARVAELRQQIASSVHEALVALDAARERLALVRDATRPQARQALEVAQIGYQAGRAAFTDVLDTVRTALAVEAEIVEAEADVWRAEATLERAVGVPLTTLAAAAPPRGRE